MKRFRLALGVAGLLSVPGWIAFSVTRYSAPGSALQTQVTASSSGGRPPDLRALAVRLGTGAVPVSPEQFPEDRRIDRKIVDGEIRASRSRSAQVRRDAVEQLSAYPTSVAVGRLLQVLAGDTDPVVRSAAAQALSSLQSPSSQVLDGLLRALRDGSAEVRANALLALENHLNRLEPESRSYRQVRRHLAKLARSPRLNKEIQRRVNDVLADLVP
jgi:hypothetical protein